MPANLKYKQRDPNGKGRGAGYYYHRGKGVYSKYSSARDKKIRAKGYRRSLIGLGKKSGKQSKIAQAGDGFLSR